MKIKYKDFIKSRGYFHKISPLYIALTRKYLKDFPNMIINITNNHIINIDLLGDYNNKCFYLIGYKINTLTNDILNNKIISIKPLNVYIPKFKKYVKKLKTEYTVSDMIETNQEKIDYILNDNMYLNIKTNKKIDYTKLY
jgi:hypothetical protein